MKTLIATLLLILSFSATAHAPETVMTHYSNPGETKDAFVERVAIFLHGYTISVKAEACGAIVERSGAYAVMLMTTGSQLSCAFNKMPTGWTLTGDSIHSHPANNFGDKVKITDETRKEMPEYNGIAFTRINHNIFSNGDYHSGPGYLVSGGNLFYQNGRGTQVKLKKLVIPE